MHKRSVVACMLGFLLSIVPVVSAGDPNEWMATAELGDDHVVSTAASESCRVYLSQPIPWAQLEACLPRATSAEDKIPVLFSLPADGEITQLSAKQRNKIEALMQVLAAHDRETVYEVKVVKVAPAQMGNYACAVLLISESMLDLLSDHELQALVAHEIGHEYLWDEYEAAKRQEDLDRLRQLELFCDAIAVATLDHLGIDRRHLSHAVEKVMRYNRMRFGIAANRDRYPTLRERKRRIGG